MSIKRMSLSEQIRFCKDKAKGLLIIIEDLGKVRPVLLGELNKQVQEIEEMNRQLLFFENLIESLEQLEALQNINEPYKIEKQ